MVCAGSLDKLAKVLKPGGHLSHIMNHGTDQAAMQKLQASGAVTVSTTLVKPDGVQLQEIFELIAAGKVKLEVAKVGFLGGCGFTQLPQLLANCDMLCRRVSMQSERSTVVLLTFSMTARLIKVQKPCVGPTYALQ